VEYEVLECLVMARPVSWLCESRSPWQAWQKPTSDFVEFFLFTMKEVLDGRAEKI
jgi:hypothetical protein